jgi:hypothetical protein
VFGDPKTSKYSAFAGAVSMTTFGRQEYQWHPGPVRPLAHPYRLGEMVVSPDEGYADPDGPPKHSTANLKPGDEVEIPAASIVVLRGKIASLPANFPLDIPNPAPSY